MKRLISFLGKLLSLLIYLLPFQVKALVAWLLAILFFDIFRFRRKVVSDNYQKVFTNLNSMTVVGRESFYHLWYNFLEFCQFPWLQPSWFDKNIEFKGLEHLDAAMAQGRGVLLLSLHMGHGDLAVSAIAQKGYAVNLISKHFKNPWANEFWFNLRRRFGVKFIDPHGQKTPFEILKALKSNQAVIFVLDQYMGPPYGVETTFFGVKTGSAYGLALFALKSQAPVLPLYGERLSGGRFCVHFEAPVEFEPQPNAVELDKDQSILFMTQKYNHVLERLIIAKPHQWMWIHRRWKAFLSSPL